VTIQALSHGLRYSTSEIVETFLLPALLFVFLPEFVLAMTAEWVGKHLASWYERDLETSTLEGAGKLTGKV
jgi:hypothetical protein